MQQLKPNWEFGTTRQMSVGQTKKVLNWMEKDFVCKSVVLMKASLILCTLALAMPLIGQNADQRAAAKTLRQVVAFHQKNVGHQGAYLWTYSADLTKQEGEGRATKTSGWTQPPGTPTVGETYLKAWRLSGEKVCLDAALECAHALVRAQLESGGWASHFDLGPEGSRRYSYRGTGKGKRNLTTFDDNKSQSALTFLMHMDEELRFRDAKIHEAVEYALRHMLAAQYPNGAWPQQYAEPPNPADHPVKKASYPKTWSRKYEGKRYTGHYTLNDNNMSFIIEMLLEAYRIYDRKDCRDAALKTGDFFILAQMPDPQPGWAQQYDANMHPVWARKFEPASITGGESQAVMKSLISLYQQTGERRFLTPIPRALAYYRKSLLPDGRLARFYELRNNKPLYFTKDYQLTYSDADMPTHYGFKVGSNLDSIERAYQKALLLKPSELKPDHRPVKRERLRSSLTKRAQKVIAALDDRGAWVESGKLRYHGKDDPTNRILSMRTFTKNLEYLAAFAGARN